MFLVGGFTTGGKERQLSTLIMHLPKDKYEVHLLMKYRESYYFDLVESELTSFYDFDKPRFSLLDIIKVRKILNIIGPDVVFSFSATLSHIILFINFFGSYYYRLINGSIRDAPTRLNINKIFEMLLYNLYKEVVANSNAGLLVYRQKNKMGRFVLHNGLDLKRVPVQRKIIMKNELGLLDSFTVTMVASMGASKDQNTFIRSAKIILEIDDSVQFYLIGEGSMRPHYEAQVKSLGIGKNVFFTGVINNVEEYLKASDLSVLMSTNAEGFPNVVMESMACGTPVLATASGGIKELLIHGENGFLINPGDYKTLAERIVFLKNNVDVLERFRKNGISIVNNKFNTDEMINKFVKILDGEATLRDCSDES